MIMYDKNDSGSTILLEYIFTIVIAAMLFTGLLLGLQSMLSKSDQIIMGEEQDIAANIVATQLADYSNEHILNSYTGLYSKTDTEQSARYFEVPKPYSGKQYSIQVQDSLDGGLHRGIVTVRYLSDPGIYSTATFNSPVPVQPKTILCNTYSLKIRLANVGGSKYLVLEEV